MLIFLKEKKASSLEALLIILFSPVGWRRNESNINAILWKHIADIVDHIQVVYTMCV